MSILYLMMFSIRAYFDILILWKEVLCVFLLAKYITVQDGSLGYCVAPAEFTKEFRKVHQFNCFSCHTPSQVALADFLRNPDTYLSLGNFFRKKEIILKS